MQATRVFIFLAVVARTLAFGVNFPQVYRQCSDFTINFGANNVPATPPYNLQLLPLGSASPRSIPIPDSAWNAEEATGSFSAVLPFGADVQFLAIVQDTNGPLAVSDVLTVVGTDNSACFLAEANQPSRNIFSFSPSPPIQCQIQTISWAVTIDPSETETDGGVFLSGLNITGYVPHGMMFTLSSALGGSFGSLSEAIWNVNIPAGQDYVLFFQYTDSLGALMEEVSPLQTVRPAVDGNVDCVRPGSPSTTAEFAVLPSTVPGSSSSEVSPSAISTEETRGKSPSQQVLIVIIAASIFALFLIIALVYCLLIRRRRRQETLEDGHTVSGVGRSQSPVSLNNSFKPLTLSPTAPLGISLSGRHSPYSDDASNYSQPSRSATPIDGSRAVSPKSQYPFLSMLPIMRTQKGQESGRKRNVKGRSKSAKDAALSVASWGNQGPLSVSLSDEDMRSIPNIPTSQSPPQGGLTSWERRSRLLTGAPFATSPPGSINAFDRLSGQSTVKIRYLDLDKAAAGDRNAPPGTAL